MYNGDRSRKNALSSGKLSISGAVRALLELSLGFEIEATGRENILYRGLLLGLKPKEIHKKVDEILEFVDLGKFIDYPIKVYSAGMQVRLAFAISTAVAGDILLLDEIIGAGDAAIPARNILTY
jgi:lipopolysaccharide transport system ATP-binding protein